MTDPQTIELTQRDRQIIELMAEGKTAEEMAKVFYKGKIGCVETYKNRLYRRLKVKNGPHLISWAYKNKILNVEI